MCCHPSHLIRAVFSPLKSSWKQVCHQFHTSNPGRNVTSYDFLGLVLRSMVIRMTFNNVTASFRVTGIYPFDRSAITLPEDEGYKEFKPEDLCRKMGLAHIPLYSPSSHSIIKKPIFINDSLLLMMKLIAILLYKLFLVPVPLAIF